MAHTASETEVDYAAANRRENRIALVVFGAFFIIGTAILAFFSNQGMHSSDLSTPQLVRMNYEVQDVQSTRTLSFNGKDVIVSVDGKVHTCRALTDDHLLSKQPITCEDGTVIQAKK